MSLGRNAPIKPSCHCMLNTILAQLFGSDTYFCIKNILYCYFYSVFDTCIATQYLSESTKITTNVHILRLQCCLNWSYFIFISCQLKLLYLYLYFIYICICRISLCALSIRVSWSVFAVLFIVFAALPTNVYSNLGEI